MAGVVPKCVALVLCERVERDLLTGFPTIVGAFDVVRAESFPSRSRAFVIWLQVTDGNGPVRMELIIERLSPQRLAAEVLVRAPFTADFRNPNEVAEHVALFDAGIELDAKGRYRLRLTASGTTITQRYFVVVDAE